MQFVMKCLTLKESKHFLGAEAAPNRFIYAFRKQGELYMCEAEPTRTYSTAVTYVPAVDAVIVGSPPVKMSNTFRSHYF